MKIVPKKKEERIGFYQAHVPTWVTNATAIGSSSANVSAVQTALTAAQAALDAQRLAQTAAKTAVQACDQAVTTLNDLGMVVIEQVRTKARTAGYGVYTLADLPVPATPTPVGAPGKPSELKVQLEDDGSLSFTWKCKNPAGSSGTIYQLWRKIGSGEITYLGGAGQKKFTDSTVPAGTSSITYQMQAVRSTAVGPWATFVVTFGVGGGAATVKETEAVKIAA